MNELKQYHSWASRLREVAREMKDVDFDMQELMELACIVDQCATRCDELAA